MDTHIDLSDFLLARIAEDEAAARAALATPLDSFPPAGSWDPVRVLAECDARRQLIDLAYEATGLDQTVDLERRVNARSDSGVRYLGDRILGALALPYAGHPDYQQEWRPQGG